MAQRRRAMWSDSPVVGAEVVIASSVRIAPLEELRSALAEGLGIPVRVIGAFSDAEWRRHRSGGLLDNLLVRVRGLLFPLTVRIAGGSGRVVVATTNPFWLPTLLSLRRVSPLVVLVYDVYPDALAVRWPIPGPVRRLVQRLFGHGLRHADAVVVLGERIASLLRTRHSLDGVLAVIPTGADPADFRVAGRWTEAEDEVLLSYVGNSGSMHEGRTLGLALRELLGRERTARVLLATRGDRAEELVGPLRGSPRVTIRAELDDAAFRSSLTATDIALVTLDAGAGAVSVPSKVYPALAAGCAVLAVAPRESDLADLIISTGSGAVVEPGDVAGAVAALQMLVRDPQRRRAHAASALAAAERFAPAVLAARWAEILRPLLPAIRVQRGPDDGDD